MCISSQSYYNFQKYKENVQQKRFSQIQFEFLFQLFSKFKSEQVNRRVLYMYVNVLHFAVQAEQNSCKGFKLSSIKS